MSTKENIEKLLSRVIGEGYEATASIFLDEEIDTTAFYSLDKETLKGAGKICIISISTQTTQTVKIEIRKTKWNEK